MQWVKKGVHKNGVALRSIRGTYGRRLGYGA